MAWQHESRNIPTVNRERCSRCRHEVFVNEGHVRKLGVVWHTDCYQEQLTARDVAIFQMMKGTGIAPVKRDSKGILKRSFGMAATQSAMKSGRKWITANPGKRED